MKRLALIISALAAIVSLALAERSTGGGRLPDRRRASLGGQLVPRKDHRRQPWAHALSLREGQAGPQRLLGYLRDLLAAPDHPWEADRGSWREELAARHDPARKRVPAGHLRRPSSVPVRRRHEARSDQWRGLGRTSVQAGTRFRPQGRRSSATVSAIIEARPIEARTQDRRRVRRSAVSRYKPTRQAPADKGDALPWASVPE